MTSLLGRLISQRALHASNFFGYATGDTINTKSGVAVTQDTATRMSAVFGAQALLTDDIATLPLKPYRNRADRGKEELALPSWLVSPVPDDPNVTIVDHLSQVVLSILSDGNAFIVASPTFGNASMLHILDPQKVDVKLGPDGLPIYLLRDNRGLESGTQFGPMDLLHIAYMRKPGRLRGLSPIEAMSEAIGSGLAAEQFSSYFFGNGANMQGVIEVPREAGEMTADQITNLSQQFRIKHQGLKNSHAIGVLQGGAHFQEMTVKPSDALLIEAQQWSVEQIARAYKIPPHLLGSQSKGSGHTYASVEQKSQDYVTHAIAPLTTRIATAYSRLLPRGSWVEFNLNGLLRADAVGRAEYYQKMLNSGGITPNRIAELENEPTFEGGDKHYIPVNNLAPIEGPAPTSPPPAAQSNSLPDALWERLLAKPEPAHFESNGATHLISTPITVTQPEIRVEAPVVNVQPPAVTVESDPAVATMLNELRTEMRRPRHKTVKRDKEQRIVEVIEE